MQKITGGCYCAQVRFEVTEDFKQFYQCHCKQCQQLTGSAFAANLITRPDSVRWLKGEQNISKYADPSRNFSKAFCTSCGSALPFVTKSGKDLIVPAGSLDRAPNLSLQAKIFLSEKVSWLHNDGGIPEFPGFPD